MSQKIVESVQAIENQAQQLKEDFQKKIDEAKIQANQKISESKKNVSVYLIAINLASGNFLRKAGAK